MKLSRSIVAVAIVTAIVVAGVGPASAQETPPDPSAAASEAARRAAEAATPSTRFAPSGQALPRFVPGPGGTWQPCENLPPADQQLAPSAGPSGVPGRWQVAAPRSWPDPYGPAGVAELTLRDVLSSGNRLVYAEVVDPSGARSVAGDMTLGSLPATLRYPSDFRAAPPLSAGAYTVIWRATADDRFIACDGFVVTE